MPLTNPISITTGTSVNNVTWVGGTIDWFSNATVSGPITVGAATTDWGAGYTTAPIYNVTYYDDKKQRIRNFIKYNITKSNFNLFKMNPCVAQKLPANELKARESLRDLISEKDWRRYLSSGFIMFKGPTRFWYQIFKNNSEKIKVYEKGILTYRICIHTDEHTCPPTDHVINMMTLIQNDEKTLWLNGNIYDSKNKSTQNPFSDPNSYAGVLLHDVLGGLPNQVVFAQNDFNQELTLSTFADPYAVKEKESLLDYYKRLKTA